MNVIPLWVKVAVVGVALLTAGSVGFGLGSKWTGDEWQAKYTAHLLSDQEGVTAALEHQQKDKSEALRRNKEIEDAHDATAKEHERADRAAADRDRIGRMLAAAAAAASGVGAVPGADHQPAVPPRSGAGGAEDVGRDQRQLEAVIAECRRNDDTLDGLTAELKPQL